MPLSHNDDMYPDLPQAILNPTSLRHKLGMFTPAEWSSFPGLYCKQIPNKARKLAKLNTELLHSQWLLRNESISDKDTITKDAVQRLRTRRPAKTLRSIDRLAKAIQRNKKRERDWYHSRQKSRNYPWPGPSPETPPTEAKSPAPSEPPPAVGTNTLETPPGVLTESPDLDTPPPLETKPPPPCKPPVIEEAKQSPERKSSTPPMIIIDLSDDEPPNIPATSQPPKHSDTPLPKITAEAWTTPLQAEERTTVHHITSKPRNHTIFALIGKVQIRWSKLHCLRPFHPSDPPESYHLNDDIIAATLHILATTVNTDRPLHIWIRDPGFYNNIINATPGEDRQETLTSLAKQLSKSINGATAFDHKWLLFPQHIRHNHWTMIAVDVPTAKIHWLDSLSD